MNGRARVHTCTRRLARTVRRQRARSDIQTCCQVKRKLDAAKSSYVTVCDMIRHESSWIWAKGEIRQSFDDAKTAVSGALAWAKPNCQSADPEGKLLNVRQNCKNTCLCSTGL